MMKGVLPASICRQDYKYIESSLLFTTAYAEAESIFSRSVIISATALTVVVATLIFLMIKAVTVGINTLLPVIIPVMS